MKRSLAPPVFLLLLAPAVPGVAQDAEPDEALPIDPDPALLCVDRKVTTGREVGLWRREIDGELVKIWDEEPYDALWRIDRTIFIAQRWHDRVVHIDLDGTVLFEARGLAEPVDVEVARDGTVVVVENRANRVVGLDPVTGERVWSRGGLNDPFDVDLLPDGGLLVADYGSGRVLRLDANGAIDLEIAGFGTPNTVEALEDGAFLVTNWSGGEVREYGPEGELRWRTRVGGTVYSAERRPDGITVVSDGANGRILYLDREGVLVKTETFAPGCVDFETILEL